MGRPVVNGVALICMPFASAGYPAIGISLLQAALKKRHITCDIYYLNLLLASKLGYRTYTAISDGTPAAALVGEWIFSPFLFPHKWGEDWRYVQEVLLEEFKGRCDPELYGEIRHARRHLAAFLTKCMNTVDWNLYDIVGFTTSFQQNCASLTLAKMVKAEHPDIITIFGGANCETEMGLAIHRQFRFIDYVCSGEGDIAFPKLVEGLLSGNREMDIDGIIRRTESGTLRPKQMISPVYDLDSLPVPCYEDYFHQVEKWGVDLQTEPLVPFESSRGCWWGQIKHCTFCGLNGSTMAFRSKSPSRALEEIVDLSSRYRKPILAVDNLLDQKYFSSFLPQLASRSLGTVLHYEVKPNLKKEQIKLLRDAGVLHVQPGLESFSDAILSLMRKGTTCLQNVQFLKWCKELGIEAHWNFLYGFPGEDPCEYETMSRLVPLLVHLSPPQFCGPVRIDRYSPYFMSPGEWGIKSLRPKRAYELIYDIPESELSGIAYYFDADVAWPENPEIYAQTVIQAIQNWWCCDSAELSIIRLSKDSIKLIDLRSQNTSSEYLFEGPAANIYVLCDQIRTPDSIMRCLPATKSGSSCGRDEVIEILNDFVSAGLMVCNGERYLALATELALSEVTPAI